MAHRIEGITEIEAEVVDIPPERVFLEAVRLNATHGKQLTPTEKKKIARKLFSDGVTPEEIQALLSISRRTFDRWVQDLRQKQAEETKHKALELYLACHTEEEIAEMLGVAIGTISTWISNFKNGHVTKNETPESLQLYNLWQFNICNEHYGMDYPGRIPGQIVENLLYYYTEPFDIVVDPMAGGGTTIDVCKAMLRRYRAYDINPVRPDIKQWDITQGFPDECKGCDLIFLDPPYWKQKRGEYSDHETNLANLSLDDFYSAMDNIFASAHSVLKKNGRIALIIGPTQEDEVIYDHAFQLYKLLEKRFTFVNRIIVPYTTQIHGGNYVKMAKEKKRLLYLTRDLVVFKK
jgi:transposase